jgi:hypothetical protein
VGPVTAEPEHLSQALEDLATYILIARGMALAEGRRQDRVERKAARRSCPICAEVA